MQNILYIIMINIRYLRWNWGAWWSFHNTNQTFLTPHVRHNNHLCDTCDLTDVNPHLSRHCFRWFENDSSCWPNVTSSIHAASKCDVTMTDCSHVVLLNVLLSQWRLGQWFKEFVKYIWIYGPVNFLTFHNRKDLQSRELFRKWLHDKSEQG